VSAWDGYHERPPDLDLGSNHWVWLVDWDPDLDLNPQWKNIPKLKLGEHAQAYIGHLRPGDGAYCEVLINFDIARTRGLLSVPDVWTVSSWNPITVTPDIICHAPTVFAQGQPPSGECGDHGSIQGRQWVPA